MRKLEALAKLIGNIPAMGKQSVTIEENVSGPKVSVVSLVVRNQRLVATGPHIPLVHHRQGNIDIHLVTS